jgi:glycosyltransferase involved in cell wall biosynthesis
MAEPGISIITPTLNRAQFIAEAIDRIGSQDWPLTEHIIVDGGSTDSTLQILRGYSGLRVVSEPDEGMFDAINQSIRIAAIAAGQA